MKIESNYFTNTEMQINFSLNSEDEFKCTLLAKKELENAAAEIGNALRMNKKLSNKAVKLLVGAQTNCSNAAICLGNFIEAARNCEIVKGKTADMWFSNAVDACDNASDNISDANRNLSDSVIEGISRKVNNAYGRLTWGADS